jgi:ribosomal protein S18 acetylase RimI-like enzyme
MAALEIVPFSDEHLDAAGELLAARHARHRLAEPLLSARFEDPAAAREELEAEWRADGASGAAALRDGRLVGYLIGASRTGGAWGENVWIEPAGHAVEETEDIRDLYGAAAAGWVEVGRRRHYAVVPATDAGLVDAWFRVGFGQQQAHGIQEVPAHVEVRVPDGFEIRAPREEEIERLLEVGSALSAHQRTSPVFSPEPPRSLDDERQEWRDTLAAGEEMVRIGWRDGRAVACWSTSNVRFSSGHHSLARPDHACCLGFAVTLPETRGSGIGVALTDASLAAAAEAGYRVMVTDWRVTNLLASRFWPRRGFRTSFLRLYRSIP